jgi:hypothetical protein
MRLFANHRYHSLKLNHSYLQYRKILKFVLYAEFRTFATRIASALTHIVNCSCHRSFPPLCQPRCRGRIRTSAVIPVINLTSHSITKISNHCDSLWSLKVHTVILQQHGTWALNACVKTSIFKAR